jgi:hypothetical protein
MSRDRDRGGTSGVVPVQGDDGTRTGGRRWLFAGALIVEALVLVALWLVGRYFTYF